MNRASRLVRTLVIPAVLLTSIALGFSPADAQVDAAKMQFTTNCGICHTADKGGESPHWYQSLWRLWTPGSQGVWLSLLEPVCEGRLEMGSSRARCFDYERPGGAVRHHHELSPAGPEEAGIDHPISEENAVDVPTASAKRHGVSRGCADKRLIDNDESRSRYGEMAWLI